MRTIYVICNRIEVSTYKYKCKYNIGPERASHKHRGFSRGSLLKQFFVFFCFHFLFFFLGVVEIDSFYLSSQEILIVNEIN